MSSHSKVQNPPAVLRQRKKHAQDLQSDGRHRERNRRRPYSVGGSRERSSRSVMAVCDGGSRIC
jgi:hypothetical protein